jgi:hypothetical protein
MLYFMPNGNQDSLQLLLAYNAEDVEDMMDMSVLRVKLVFDYNYG